jgi:NitT/TauT family transport system permease protein
VAGLIEYASRSGIVSPFILPAPSDIVRSFTLALMQGRYSEPALSTVASTVGGFMIAAVFASALAALMAMFKTIERVIMPYVAGIQAIPKVAIVPLVFMALGYGIASKLVIVAIIAFFPILINALQGFAIRERERVELMESLGATRIQTFRYIRLPGSLPYLFAGFQIGIVFGLIGAVVAEFLGSPDGLGVLILQEQARFNAAGLWGVLVVLMLIGALMRESVRQIERLLTPWSQERAATI